MSTDIFVEMSTKPSSALHVYSSALDFSSQPDKIAVQDRTISNYCSCVNRFHRTTAVLCAALRYMFKACCLIFRVKSRMAL